MTSKTRRTFTDEFKREAVALLAGGGQPLTQVATELGIQPLMLRAWRGHGTMTAGWCPFRRAPPVAPPCYRPSRPRVPPAAEGARSGADGVTS